jgi:phage shock protein C
MEEQTTYKRVFRSRKDRILGGVCGGIANYFNIDPVLVRILWVIAMFVYGFGFLGYIVAWIIIPEEPMVFK